MQSLSKKIFLLFCCTTSFMHSLAQVKYIERQIFIADSLYQEKIFKKSITIHEETLNEGLAFSEKSLLQMSSIYFASKDTAKSLQTLEILYSRYPDDLYLNKINEYSAKIENSTFSNASSFDQLLPYFNKYSKKVIASLLIITTLTSIFWLVCVFFFKKNHQVLLVISILFIILTLFTNNIDTRKTYVIPKSKFCNVRKEPSNASSVILRTTELHKFKVIDINDIWIKVQLEDSFGFINKNQLLFVI